MKRRRTLGRRSGPGEVSKEGVDRSLIRWMLSLSPRQWLQVLENHLRLVRALRGNAAAVKEEPDLEKDGAMLPTLRETLDMRRARARKRKR